MGAGNWISWCRMEKNICVASGHVTVTFQNGRTQRVAVDMAEDTIELTSLVTCIRSVPAGSDPRLRAWRRNRSAHGVGFGEDDQGRLVARAWMPRAGATKKEFLDCVRHLAAEADLFEYQLTGKDRN